MASITHQKLPVWENAANEKIRRALKEQGLFSFLKLGGVHVSIKQRNQPALRALVKKMGVAHGEVIEKGQWSSNPNIRRNPYEVAIRKLLQKSKIELPPEHTIEALHIPGEGLVRIKIMPKF
ncbi:MAG TPA: hypothetical protein VGQ00_04400 [Candidatus Norongarragalinales archaeon]|jgi:hypothetical protein|nr:hypothetical protein [Candidatus Norongarragalinales archaeon]